MTPLGELVKCAKNDTPLNLLICSGHIINEILRLVQLSLVLCLCGGLVSYELADSEVLKFRPEHIKLSINDLPPGQGACFAYFVTHISWTEQIICIRAQVETESRAQGHSMQ